VSEVFQNIHPLKEISSVGGLVCEDDFSFFHIKGIVETLLEGLGIKGIDFVPCDCAHLSNRQRASVLKGNVVLGALGRLEQGVAKNLKLPSSIYLFEFDFSRLIAASSEERKRFHHLPRFPALRRDLAIIVAENISAKDVKQGILKGGKWLERVDFFDLYRGEGMPSGHKSLAFSLVFRASDRTLTDKEVDQVQEKIVNLLKIDLGASIREG
jgi:phenylalanyl-tRNA synthetase beta chain